MGSHLIPHVPTPTIDQLLAEAVERLAAAGIADARLDAERLLRHVLGWDRATLLVRARDPLPDTHQETFRSLVAQRAQRRPLQHLVGTQAFWRHEFLVTPDVLIPRPETELLVEHGLAALAGVPRPVVVDVGTGTGCVALSLAAERPDAETHAIDISEAALAVARTNAERLGLTGRVRFHRGDLLAPVASLAGRVDLVVSNPPYVEEGDLDSLAPEVRDHEPRTALTPGEGVPHLYQRLFEGTRAVLRPGGWAIVEVGLGGASTAAALARQAGLKVLRTNEDLQGIPRALVSRLLDF